jgi:hypothetical protein
MFKCHVAEPKWPMFKCHVASLGGQCLDATWFNLGGHCLNVAWHLHSQNGVSSIKKSFDCYIDQSK